MSDPTARLLASLVGSTLLAVVLAAVLTAPATTIQPVRSTAMDLDEPAPTLAAPGR